VRTIQGQQAASGRVIGIHVLELAKAFDPFLILPNFKDILFAAYIKDFSMNFQSIALHVRYEFIRIIIITRTVRINPLRCFGSSHDKGMPG